MGRAFEYRKAAKLKRWGTMSKLFPKLGKMITIAAKEGGSQDPEMNSKLRTAIANAKAKNMPKENIEAAIKRAFNKDAADIKEIVYEAKAPYGVQLIITTATDNNTRTVANVKAILRRGNAELLASGSLNYIFTKRAEFIIDRSEIEDLEELELELIDYGLEEIVEDVEPQEVGEDKKIVRIYGEFTSFGELNSALEERGIKVQSAKIVYTPNTTVELDEKKLSDIETLVEKLEDDDDVQEVFTNLT